MDNIIFWAVLGIVVVLVVFAFVWEVARSTYFSVAAKLYGWSRRP
jgi:FtsH-binding integral membrane protein